MRFAASTLLCHVLKFTQGVGIGNECFMGDKDLSPVEVVQRLLSTGDTDSGIVMVDGCFMVDGPCVNHAEKAVNHVLWLTGLLGRWLTEPCLISNFELSGHQFGTILKSFILTFQSASI